MPSTDSQQEAPKRGRGRPRIPMRLRITLVRRDYFDTWKLARVLRGLHAQSTEQPPEQPLPRTEEQTDDDP